MTRKGMVLIVAVVMGLLLSAPFPAQAKLDWYTCTVQAAGPMWQRIYVKLSHAEAPKAFDTQWFILRRDQEKEMFSVALMAMNNGMKVRAYMDPAKDPSYILNLFVLP